MNSKFAEKELYTGKSFPLPYSIKRQEDFANRRVLQSSSGMFYISMIALVFLCLGVFLNISLKIQSINYEKKIFETNKLILLEKERSDRLQLKISGLKSPAKILSMAESELGMKISDNIKIMRITGVNLQNNSEINYLIEKKSGSELKIYDNFLKNISGLEDIVMVVSEGILTFFIP
jgi:cell division protein FtsL